MKIDQVFEVIENLDYPEGLRRRLAPRYSLLQVNRAGEVVAVERFKELPTQAEQIEMLNKNPGTIQLTARPGLCASPDELKQRVKSQLVVFSMMKPG